MKIWSKFEFSNLLIFQCTKVFDTSTPELPNRSNLLLEINIFLLQTEMTNYEHKKNN